MLQAQLRHAVPPIPQAALCCPHSCPDGQPQAHRTGTASCGLPATPGALAKVGVGQRGERRREAPQRAEGAPVHGGQDHGTLSLCTGAQLTCTHTPSPTAHLILFGPRGESGLSPLCLDPGKAEPSHRAGGWREGDSLGSAEPQSHSSPVCPVCVCVSLSSPGPGVRNDAVPFRGHSCPHFAPEPPGRLVERHRSHAGVRSL